MPPCPPHDIFGARFGEVARHLVLNHVRNQDAKTRHREAFKRFRRRERDQGRGVRDQKAQRQNSRPERGGFTLMGLKKPREPCGSLGK